MKYINTLVLLEQNFGLRQHITVLMTFCKLTQGEIIGKAIIKDNPNVFSGSQKTKGSIKYTIKIFVKEGRYKYEITDFIHDPYGNQYGKSSMGLITTDKECLNPKGWSNKVLGDIKTQIEDNMTSLIASLKDEMTKKN